MATRGDRPEQWPGSLFDSVTVYVLCGHKRYTFPDGSKKWVHYIGATSDLKSRLFAHRNGTSGAKLPAAMRRQGIRLLLARTWSFDLPDDGWKFEKRLKAQHCGAQHCPRCSGRRNAQKARSKRDLRAARRSERRRQGGQLEMAFTKSTRRRQPR